MQPEQFSSRFNTHRLNPCGIQRVSWFSSVGALGLTLALGVIPAQADTDLVIEAPQPVESTPTPVESVPPAAPVETSAESLLQPEVTTAPTPAPASASPALSIEPTAPAPRSTPAPAAPVTESVPAVESLRGQQGTAPESFSNTFIDPTEYGLGATPSADAPAIVFSDRTRGCQFRLQQGQSISAGACGTAGAAGNGEIADGTRSSTAGSAVGGSSNQFSVGPIGVGGNGVTFGNTTVISREYFNERLRSLNLLRRGAEEFVFPLAIPSPITSLFGWRMHPIFGDRRFHTGTDLGAPEGTPVVATQDGEVHVADYLGGYGLTVILRHAEGALETRYAHLSQILVRPGETVQQGEVIGLVGSTGNSTGPHLHFELRELTAQGWILLNPDELIGYAMANLSEALNNPLLALGLDAEDKAETTVEGEKHFELPHRPAQPNAN